MDDDRARWRRLESIVHAALARPVQERAAYLAEACGGDEELQREAASLVDRDERTGGFLAGSLAGLAAGAVAPLPALQIGQAIAHYRIVKAIGTGGMGEVYLANDSRLDRQVALKILPPELAGDAARRSRFAREARAVAALNHPNIVTVYAVEEADGLHFITMELVRGRTLAELLPRTGFAVRRFFEIAIPLADALAAAHQQGITHRDLKPTNVMAGDDGRVKVLDFGLAKTALDAWTREGTVAPLSATAEGHIVGTPAYMSPEQAEGKKVDARSDIFSLGIVFYEMLTGARPFGGDSPALVLASIVKDAPRPLGDIKPAVPRRLARLVQRCLEKGPGQRYQSAIDLRHDLEEIQRDEASVSAVPGRTATSRASRGIAVACGLGVVIAAAGAASIWPAGTGGGVEPASGERRPTPAPSPVVRVGITLPAAQPIAISFNDRDVALSPDGTHLVYTAGAESQLMVRALDRLDFVPLAGITGARAPFVSPDAQWVGYFDRIDEGLTIGPVLRGTLKRVPIGGGPPSVIAQVSGGSRGASWGADDSIVYATNDPTTGLLRVAARGGEPEVLTRPDKDGGEQDHFFPSLLPGGRAALFTVLIARNQSRVAVLDLDTGRWKTVIRSGSQAVYAETGHLVYQDGGALWAVRFDTTAQAVVGDPVPVLERATWYVAAANFALSRHGMLVYAPSAGAGDARSLVWVDRHGNAVPTGAPARRYYLPRLSPDGTRVAVSIGDGQGAGLWTWDFSLQKLSPLHSEPVGTFLEWSRDSRYLIFGARNLFRRAADGTGAVEPLTTSAGDPDVTGRRAVAVSPDGKHLIFERLTPATSYDLMLRPLDGPVTSNGGANGTVPLLATPSDERNAAFAPDGRWLAYESNRTGQFQVYVRPFPNVNDAEYQISTAGGRTPLFAPNGRELFFVGGPALMAVAVESRPAFRAGNPTVVFNEPSLILDGRRLGNTGRTYEVSSDGQRFLMVKDDEAAAAQGAPPGIVVVQNWFEELKARLPVAR